ncbi:hypothetical protein BSZ39_12320 [Bowdeniella nasicola]|uniref:Uncharacterized protein n=1 Tax=Bowdeniella nasicola TaxID=208480 RepID=A0A1Q5PZR4_9ACTO|nr:hypothetical protein BSZ39_12320 [Bowdeniella nasicola]
MLDLATRGFLRISEVQRDGAGDPDDWAITLISTPTPPEQEFERRTLVSLNLHTMVFDGEKPCA